MNKQYLPNLFKSSQWKDLTEVERRQFGKAFVEKAEKDNVADEDLFEVTSSGSFEEDSLYFKKRMIELEEEESGI